MLWGMAAAAVLAAGAVLGLGALDTAAQDTGARLAPGPVTVVPAATRAAVPTGSEPLGERSAPMTVRIPTIGVSALVGSMGLNADNTVEVPTRPEETGWYRGGPTPGQLGSAVILGHVDSISGPAVFARLRKLHQGDKVDVTLANGGAARFAVDRVVTYPNADFPAQEVYGSHGVSSLQLVTCGGPYDHVAKSYTANVVVYSSLVSTTPAPWLPTPRPAVLSPV